MEILQIVFRKHWEWLIVRTDQKVTYQWFLAPVKGSIILELPDTVIFYLIKNGSIINHICQVRLYDVKQDKTNLRVLL